MPRPLLEDFAAQIASTNTSESIAQVYDQYLNFIVSEPELFSLGMGKEAYWTLNSGKATDQELDSSIERIVNGLFSVSVTMASIPIIRSPSGGAAQEIATKLDRKLRDHVLNSKDNLFSNAARHSQNTYLPASRPVLIILDRKVDLVPMLSHSWTYQSLVHDVLKMHLNRITVAIADKDNPSAKPRDYDLSANDFFWTRNASAPFPQVAEDIDAELTKYKAETNTIVNNTPGAHSLEDVENQGSASAAHLKAAIGLLPELKERKATIDMHMNIATALMMGIKERRLDVYYELEEVITKKSASEILQWITSEVKEDTGTEPLDKLRIFIIWYLSTEQEPQKAEMTRFKEALLIAGVPSESVDALKYIQRVRLETKMTMITSAVAPAQQTSQPLFGGFSALKNVTGLLAQGPLSGVNLDTVLSGVKNLMPVNRDLTVTKIVESIMDPPAASSSAIAKTENYLYFDPRNSHARGTTGGPGSSGQVGTNASFGQRRQGYSEAIVFTVGGGSMDEYGNLQEWVKRTSGATNGAGAGGISAGQRARKIVYGSTEIVNAEDFVGQLARLGQED